MPETDLSLAASLSPSPAGWLPAVLNNFNDFLGDHASCEKKASGMALAVASHYPDRPALLTAMAELAVEELAHYREVIKFMVQRQLKPSPDTKDPYIHALNQCIRRGSENFLLDRLLVGAVVERRGAERFALIAQALRAQETELADLAEFYTSIAASEARHWELFVNLALSEGQQQASADYASRAVSENPEHAAATWHRFNELTALEADVLASVPLRAALH